MSVATDNGGISIALSTSQGQRDGDGFELDVSMQLPGKGVTAIFGPSGAGKTTLLRCVAGLQRTAQGVVKVNGQCWQDRDTFMPTHKRALGYVFQESGLFPHLSVLGNIEFAAKRTRTAHAPVSLAHLADVLDIEPLLSRLPADLSGGEKQRVAIARALMCQPQLLLMDEPLASLDQARKQEILPYLERVHAELACPVLYVSHAMPEVTRLADYAVLMEQGRVVRQGKLNHVFGESLQHNGFEEHGAVIDARVIRKDNQWQLLDAAFSGGELCLADSGCAVGDEVRLHIPAKDVSIALSTEDKSSIANRIKAVVDHVQIEPERATAMVRLRCGDEFILACVTRRSVAELSLDVGQSVYAQIKSVAIVR